MLPFLLAFALVFGPASPAAQVAGDVRDPDGLLISGATVILRSRDLPSREGFTDRRGQFHFTGLAAGEYRIQVQMTGFRSSDAMFTLAEGQEARTTIGLKLGQLTEVVNVMAARSAGAPPPSGRGRGAAPRPSATPAGNPPQLPPVLPPVENMRTGGRVEEPKKTQSREPPYPPAALAKGIVGTVIAEATIGADGRIASPTIVRGEESLDEAVLKAVSEWRYTPARLNGKPVPVQVVVIVNFSIR